jgi:hypothetical protein
METIATTEVVQVGMTSRIHISAVNTKIAMTLCWVSVKIGSAVTGSTPKKEVGTKARKNVMTHTPRKLRQRFTFIGWPKNEK